MSIPKFSLCWNSYESNICSGFSRLRQDAEFVDMTLAAEGHLLKVHQNLIALASPYLKEMLQSAACQHPVIFLNNVSHKVLSYLLEYIYTGQVEIPSDMLSGFLDASMALQIRGVEKFVPTQNIALNVEKLPESNFAAHITINTENFNLEVQPLHNPDHDYSLLSKESVSYPTIEVNPSQVLKLQNDPDDVLAVDNFEENSQNLMDINDVTDMTPQLPNLTEIPDTNINTVLPHQLNNIQGEEIPPTVTPLIGLTPQYTISNRGSLQLILNRNLYYFHHQSCGGRKRRWRCADYRKMHCTAFIDTDGEAIVKREGIHCHAYHDSKIDKKRKKSLVYKSIASVEIGAKYFNGNKFSEDEEDDVM